jgi:hypothetical protein
MKGAGPVIHCKYEPLVIKKLTRMETASLL